VRKSLTIIDPITNVARYINPGELANRFIYSLQLFAIIFVLSAFFLPGTFLAQLSPIYQLLARCPIAIETLCPLFMILLMLRVRGAVLEQKALAALFCLYMTPYVLAVFTGDPESRRYSECFSVLYSYSIDLCAVLIASSIRQVTASICFLGMLQGLYVLCYLHDPIHQFISGETRRACGTFDNPDGLYTLMIVCVPLALAFLMESTNFWARVYWIACGSIAFSGLVLTWYRAPAIAVSVGIIYLLVRAVPTTVYKRRLLIACVACMAAMVLLVAFVRTRGEINEASAIRSDSGRIQIWGQGLHILEQHWLCGVGPGAMKIEVMSSSLHTTARYSIVEEPKNVVLLLLDQFGLGGGLLFVSMSLTIYRILRDSRDMIGLGLGSVWITLFVAGMFDSPFGIGPRACGNALVACLIACVVLLPKEFVTSDA